MNDAKLVLAKKKEILEQFRNRKKIRELEKLESNGYKNFACNSNAVNNCRLSDQTKDFENLTPDEILKKCGINDLTGSSASSTLTPSSSTHSFSSSNHSIFAIYNSSNATNGSTNASGRLLRDIESVKKQIENLSLKTELNSCHKINIFPSELIKYDKEIQTNQSVLLNNHNKKATQKLSNSFEPDTGSGATTEEEDSDAHDEKNFCSKLSRGLQLKPLAYFEEVFVHDTFQWEDEFGQHGHHHSFEDCEKGTNMETADKITKGTDSSCNKNSINGEINNVPDAVDYDFSEAAEQNHQLHRTSSHLSLFLDMNEFSQFLREKRPVVERALKQNELDIFIDYTASGDDEKNRLQEENRIAVKFKKRIPTPEKFNNSIVTSLDWSIQYPEMILASYDNMPINYEEIDTEAAIVLWNVRSDLKLPQQIFTNTSLITTCLFSQYQPNLVFAGTYSGQICMWDIRSNKRTPIQKTCLSASSHMSPVYCVRVLDSTSGQNLVSISNDGKLCNWSIENLNSPIDSQDLIVKHSTNKAVYATCIDLQYNVSPNGDDRSLAIVGTEDGFVHSFNLSNYGIERTFEDHFGPITSLSSFPSYMSHDKDVTNSNVDSSLTQLFLTSSFDSSVKLWNMTESSKPLYTFDSSGTDYVFDVAWSPNHPALFACVDGAGRLDFWNLNKSIEMATISIEVDKRRALNKLKWSPRKGTEIIIGDDHGEISLYELSENFANPMPDEYQTLKKTLKGIQNLNKELQSIKNSEK